MSMAPWFSCLRTVLCIEGFSPILSFLEGGILFCYVETFSGSFGFSGPSWLTTRRAERRESKFSTTMKNTTAQEGPFCQRENEG